MRINDAFVEGVPEPGMVMIEIGERGEFTPERSVAAADMIIAAANRWPNVPLDIVMGGYDDDPRELWQIDDARDFVAGVFKRVVAEVPGFDFRLKLTDVAWGLVGLCTGALYVKSRDPQTGSYDLAVRSGASDA